MSFARKILAKTQDPIFLKKADWGVRADGGFPQPPPGTWFDPKGIRAFRQLHSFALYCCPKCKGVRALPMAGFKITREGLVTTRAGDDVACGTDARTRIPCDFRRETYLLGWGDKALYACAIERFEQGTYKAVIRYTHADTLAEARKQFVLGVRDRIVALAPCIAYFVEDKEGLILNVD